MADCHEHLAVSKPVGPIMNNKRVGSILNDLSWGHNMQQRGYKL